MKPVFKFIPEGRKNNVTVAVHAGPAGKAPKYAGTLTFHDKATADQLLAAMQSVRTGTAEFHVEP